MLSRFPRVVSPLVRGLAGRGRWASAGSAQEDDAFSFEPFQADKKKWSGSALVAPLLPKNKSETPHLLEHDLGDDMTLMIGASSKLSPERPGNGGFRIWGYDSKDAAAAEAVGLAQGMEVKHLAYNTGYSGAKVVCDVGANRPVDTIDKKALLNSLHDVLVSLDGKMYTGCDLNSTLDDMAYLASKSPYVLAAIGNDKVDPNHATAHGVVGALLATLRPDMADACDGTYVTFNRGGQCSKVARTISQMLQGRRLLVHGCGAVGSVVAAELAAMGAIVFTIDAFPERAEIPGCLNLTGRPEGKEWWRLEVDVLVPCSKSGLITPTIARELRCQHIVGASNLPFESEEAQRIAEEPVAGVREGIHFLPEGITSAGAVIVDSVEQFDSSGFVTAHPNDLYAFCRQQVFQKAAEVQKMGCVQRSDLSVRDRLKNFLHDQAEAQHDEQAPIGGTFSEWKSDVLDFPHTATDATASASISLPNPAFNSFSSSASTVSSSSQTRQQVSATLRSFTSRTGAAAAPGGSKAFSTAAGEKADVVICGGGIMGLNIAYNLKNRDPALKVVVLERAPALGHGSSGWSTGFLRAFYSFDETMRLALDGINAYKNWSAYTGLKEVRAHFTETGALWMLGKPKCDNDTMHARLRDFGVDSVVLDAQGVKEMYPAINTDPYPEYNDEGEETGKVFPELSALFEKGCGHMDSSSCLEDVLDACVRDGVDVRFGTGVASVLQEGGRASGVKLENGSTIATGSVVNCLGPWFGKLNATVGIKTSTTMLPTRIQVGHINIEDEEHLRLPFTADAHGASGIYFMPRRTNKQLVFGSVDHRFESEIVEDPDKLDTMLDHEVQADYMGCLLHRLPTLPPNGKVIGFSHMYTVNQEDVHPVIGESELKGFFLCNGFSGHGFKLAPAVGSMVTQQILGSTSRPEGKLGQWQTSVPLDFMSSSRAPLSLKVKTHFA